MEKRDRKKKKQPKFLYKKYRIYVADHVRDRFDIFEEKTNGTSGKKSESLIGYGFRFEEMLEKLCRIITSEKDIHEFRDYVSEYKKQKAEFQSLLK